MKILVTGSEGFVGKHLRREFERQGHQVIGLDRRPGPETMRADLRRADSLREIVGQIRPDGVIHLAGEANVRRSWQQPAQTMELNVTCAANLLEALRQEAPDARVLLVGSSDMYGSLPSGGEAVTEETPLSPMSPYAVSKAAQEGLGRLYCRAYGLQICMTRSFNHSGAGQGRGFIIPDFAWGIVQVERGQASALRVGNLEARRDYTHVEDIVRAYRLLLERGTPGQVYNVGSGQAYSGQEILDRLLALAAVPVPVEQDPARLRPSDMPVICCSHDRLTRDTGWQPEKGLEDILRDVLAWYRQRPE